MTQSRIFLSSLGWVKVSEKGWKRRMEGGRTCGRPKQPNVTPEAPSQRQRPIRKLLLSVGKGPGDIFLAYVPLSTSNRHRRDNEILILSDLGPPRQDHVTWYFNDHNSGNTAWLWRRNSFPSPIPKGAHVTGRDRKWDSETEHGSPMNAPGPLGAYTVYAR